MAKLERESVSINYMLGASVYSGREAFPVPQTWQCYVGGSPKPPSGRQLQLESVFSPTKAKSGRAAGVRRLINKRKAPL